MLSPARGTRIGVITAGTDACGAPLHVTPRECALEGGDCQPGRGYDPPEDLSAARKRIVVAGVEGLFAPIGVRVGEREAGIWGLAKSGVRRVTDTRRHGVR